MERYKNITLVISLTILTFFMVTMPFAFHKIDFYSCYDHHFYQLTYLLLTHILQFLRKYFLVSKHSAEQYLRIPPWFSEVQ